MPIEMSVKPTLTDELLKVNSALKPIFSVIEISVVDGSEVRSEEDGISTVSKQAHVKLVNKQPSNF